MRVRSAWTCTINQTAQASHTALLTVLPRVWRTPERSRLLPASPPALCARPSPIALLASCLRAPCPPPGLARLALRFAPSSICITLGLRRYVRGTVSLPQGVRASCRLGGHFRLKYWVVRAYIKVKAYPTHMAHGDHTFTTHARYQHPSQSRQTNTRSLELATHALTHTGTGHRALSRAGDYISRAREGH